MVDSVIVADEASGMVETSVVICLFVVLAEVDIFISDEEVIITSSDDTSTKLFDEIVKDSEVVVNGTESEIGFVSVVNWKGVVCSEIGKL